jgi:hypothetical protein
MISTRSFDPEFRGGWSSALPSQTLEGTPMPRRSRCRLVIQSNRLHHLDRLAMTLDLQTIKNPWCGF